MYNNESTIRGFPRDGYASGAASEAISKIYGGDMEARLPKVEAERVTYYYGFFRSRQSLKQKR